MIQFYVSLVSWLPTSLQLICTGVIAIFFLMAIVNLIAFILDIIPFL